MAKPRYMQYAKAKRRDGKKSGFNLRKFFLTVFALVIIAASCWAFMKMLPVTTSVSRNDNPPGRIGEINDYSSARWLLQDAHGHQLAGSIAWYFRVYSYAAESVEDLTAAGMAPFLFSDGNNSDLRIYSSVNEGTNIASDFYLRILTPTRMDLGYESRRSLEESNIFGVSWIQNQDEVIQVSPNEETSLIGQYLNNESTPDDKFACYLAQIWEVAVGDYIQIYQRPPKDMDDLMTNLGFRINPECIWPLEEDSDVTCEGGLIDGKIVYWKITLSDGETRGQARYWDHFTTYNDPDIPENIMTESQNSPVVNPDEIGGSFNAIYTLEIMRALLTPSEEEEDGE